MNIIRPGWDRYFMNIAREVAQRATCPRAKCGTVLIDPITHRILATGYNGSLAGQPHCIDNGCLMIDGHCKRTIHSEMNAILHAARYGISLDGSHAYIYGERADGEIKHVCEDCAMALSAANVTVIRCEVD